MIPDRSPETPESLQAPQLEEEDFARWSPTPSIESEEMSTPSDINDLTKAIMTALQQSSGTAPPVYKPDSPTMGGVIQYQGKDYVAWTGGKPKADWSGLEDSTASYKNPRQPRGNSVSGEQKAFSYRTQGLQEKFSQEGDLSAFIQKVEKHLVHYGLDSIAYLPDPQDKQTMRSVITEHARFSVENAKDEQAKLVTKYDEYGKKNNEAAAEFLFDSLSLHLSRRNCALSPKTRTALPSASSE